MYRLVIMIIYLTFISVMRKKFDHHASNIVNEMFKS